MTGFITLSAVISTLSHGVQSKFRKLAHFFLALYHGKLVSGERRNMATTVDS